MELENVIKLINAVSESSLTSFSMEDGDTKLSLGADRSDRAAVKETAGADDIVNSDNGNESGLNKSDIKTSDDNVLTVNSPLVGVFYSSASPEADAYVAIGDRVKKGQVIGIVEAMKLMNEIESDYDGVASQAVARGMQVVVDGDAIIVTSADDTQVNIYNMQGAEVATGMTNTPIILNGRGVFVVKTNHKAVKIVK